MDNYPYLIVHPELKHDVHHDNDPLLKHYRGNVHHHHRLNNIPWSIVYHHHTGTDGPHDHDDLGSNIHTHDEE